MTALIALLAVTTSCLLAVTGARVALELLLAVTFGRR